jgi:branched-subunit amino acid aminotransferase/4-amino-4-deoxychorismate lyase
MDFIVVNGEIIKKKELKTLPFFLEEPFIITRKIWFGFGGIPLFAANLENLDQVLQILNIETPELLQNRHELFRLSKRMLNKNKFYRSGIITLQVLSGQTETNTVISSFAFPEFDFPFSKTGILMNFSEFEKYSASPLNQYEFYNLPNWKFAEARIQNTAFQNSILVNEKENVCECIAANIFMIKGNTLLTPGTETGCYTDSIRNHILEVAPEAGLKVQESATIKSTEVVKMSEIFIASEADGIRWVMGIGNKRFVHRFAAKIHQLLNKRLEQLIRK